MTLYDTDDYDTDEFMKKVEKGARAHHRALCLYLGSRPSM